MDASARRTELVQIVEKILDPPSDMPEEEENRLVEKFATSIPHPAGSDLIFYPEHWGLPDGLSADRIVNEALSWRPRIMALRVTYVRPNPWRKDLFCIGVEWPGRIETQIVSPKKYKVGDICVVGLSGVRLASGRILEHGFVSKAFSAGEILGTTDAAPGVEFSDSDFPDR